MHSNSNIYQETMADTTGASLLLSTRISFRPRLAALQRDDFLRLQFAPEVSTNYTLDVLSSWMKLPWE